MSEMQDAMQIVADISELRADVKSLRARLTEMTADRDHWRDAHLTLIRTGRDNAAMASYRPPTKEKTDGAGNVPCCYLMPSLEPVTSFSQPTGVKSDG